MLNHRLVRYIVVGATAYLLEMGVLYGLHRGVGLSSVRAVAVSFWVGFIVAFILQKVITFQNYERRVHMLTAQLIGYSGLVLWNYLITLTAVKLFENHASVFIIRTIVIILVTLWNYALYRLLFRTAVKQ